MNYNIKSILTNGTDFLGFRFVSEENSTVLDVAKGPLFEMMHTKPCDSIEEAKEFLEKEMRGAGLSIGNNVGLVFDGDVDEYTISDDLVDPGYFGLHTQFYKVQLPTPDVTGTHDAALDLTNLVYNTEFYELFNVRQVVGLGTDAKDGAFSFRFTTYYPSKMADAVYAAMVKYLDEMGISDVTVAVDTTTKPVSYEIKANVGARFGKATMGSVQMNLLKSKTPALSSANVTAARDEHGITYSIPADLDIYNCGGVHVEEVKNLIMFRQGAATFVRPFYDCDEDKMWMLEGTAPLDALRNHMSLVYVPQFVGMLSDLPILEDIADTEVVLPIIRTIGEDKYLISGVVEFNESEAPCEIEELVDSLREVWLDAMYSADFDLKKTPMGLKGDVEYDGENIIFSITAEK